MTVPFAFVAPQVILTQGSTVPKVSVASISLILLRSLSTQLVPHQHVSSTSTVCFFNASRDVFFKSKRGNRIPFSFLSPLFPSQNSILIPVWIDLGHF